MKNETPTLLDQFAMAALPAIIKKEPLLLFDQQRASEQAYSMAYWMMRTRKGLDDEGRELEDCHDD